MIRQVVLFNADPDRGATGLDSLRQALSQCPGVRRSHVGADIPGSWGGLGLTWDALLDDHAPALEVQTSLLPLGRVDAVRFRPFRGAGPEPGITDCVKRTLLLRVRPGAPAPYVEQLEHDLAAMPAHIPAIRNWSLARVDPALQPSSWTHVWEQEYRTLDGLAVDYLASPFHWGWVDRWFDPEMPEHIVDVRLAHVFTHADASILSWDAALAG